MCADRDIWEALDRTLSGRPVSGSQKPKLAPSTHRFTTTILFMLIHLSLTALPPSWRKKYLTFSFSLDSQWKSFARLSTTETKEIPLTLWNVEAYFCSTFEVLTFVGVLFTTLDVASSGHLHPETLDTARNCCCSFLSHRIHVSFPCYLSLRPGQLLNGTWIDLRNILWYFSQCSGVCTGSGFRKIYACHMVTPGSEQLNSRVS